MHTCTTCQTTYETEPPCPNCGTMTYTDTAAPADTATDPIETATEPFHEEHQPAVSAPSTDEPDTSNENNWAMGAHISPLAGSIVAFPVLGPLVMFFLKDQYGPFARKHVLEALNFNISMTIYMFVSWILVIVAVGFLLIPIVAVLWIIFPILGAVKASNGEEYRYPLTIRLVS